MLRRQSIAVATAAGLVLLVAAGCLKRKETITVHPDGSVDIKLKYKGEPAEFETEDALPSAESGWDVAFEIEKNGDKEKRVLRSERSFAPGQRLPRSYAGAADPDSDLCLDFPTTVRTERRPDGTYYHFRREYAPRTWANVRYWYDRFINDDIKKLGEKETKDLSLGERVKITKAFVDAVAHEQVEYSRAALAKIDPTLAQDHWLLARRSLLNVYDAIDLETIVREYQQLPEKQREEEFEREGQEIEDRARAAVCRSLRDSAGYDAARIAEFQTAYDRAYRRYEITNQLGGHGFHIRVRMPGEIIAHNADRIGDNGAHWEFNGEAFHDRPYELMITSRVANDGEGD
ncbi:MAG: hypothetical protein ACE5F9_06870 [Phycisphaerae bacterium]